VLGCPKKKNHQHLESPPGVRASPSGVVCLSSSGVVWRLLASSLLSFASTTASVADAQMSATAAAIAVVARWVRELVATRNW